MFSKTCQYAFRAVIYIALNSSEKKLVGLKEIASAQDLPTHFLGKILQILVKKKILKSVKGPHGGFRLHKDKQLINLKEIYVAIDGTDTLTNCIIGFDECSSDRPCPLHSFYEPIKHKFLKMLNKKSLDDLCHDIETQKSFVSYAEVAK